MGVAAGSSVVFYLYFLVYDGQAFRCEGVNCVETSYQICIRIIIQVLHVPKFLVSQLMVNIVSFNVLQIEPLNNLPITTSPTTAFNGFYISFFKVRTIVDYHLQHMRSTACHGIDSTTKNSSSRWTLPNTSKKSRAYDIHSQSQSVNLVYCCVMWNGIRCDRHTIIV